MKLFQSCTSTCHVHTFMQKLEDLYWYDYQWRTECAPTLGHFGLLNKSVYGTRDAARNWERDWRERDKS